MQAKVEMNIKLQDHKSLWSKIKSSDKIQCYLLIALPLIGFFVFTIYPIIWSAIKSFYYYDLVPSNTRFVGLKNFITLFTNGGDYWSAWLVTLKFLMIKLPIEIPLALVLAVLLNKGIKGSGFFRNMYYLPCVVSMAIIGVIFANLFDPFGVINAWLLKCNIISQPIEWFGNASTSLAVLIIGGIWSSFGINVVYFTAALSNVPNDVYEAADIEGAGAIAKFFRITVPMISSVFQTVLLLAINGTLKTGELILVMTNGAPAGRTLTAEAYVMQSFLPGFSTGMPNIGYGCALSIISSIICAAVGILYMRLSRNMSNIY